ncbi:18619_t:CDS:2, partial [Rhizophagus irregularis]
IRIGLPKNIKIDIFKEDAIKQKIKRQDRDVNDMQIEEFAFEQSVSQTDQITIIDNNNEEKGKSKRIYSVIMMI